MYGTKTMAMTLAFTVGLAATAAPAPILGQVDTFAAGTAGWVVGDQHPSPPSVVTGGPGGATDSYLQLRSIGGAGAGSKVSAFNEGQWAGDYLAANIAAISMDVRNDGPQDVVLRLLLAGPFGAMGPENVVVTSDAASLAAGSGWVPVTFSLQPSDLFVLLGSAGGALSQAAELRLFHNPAPFFAGPPESGSPAVVATVGIDNVTAEGAVPEPGSALLLGLGAAWCATRRRRTQDDI
jgi:hypothetical protein